MLDMARPNLKFLCLIIWALQQLLAPSVLLLNNVITASTTSPGQFAVVDSCNELEEKSVEGLKNMTLMQQFYNAWRRIVLSSADPAGAKTGTGAIPCGVMEEDMDRSSNYATVRDKMFPWQVLLSSYECGGVLISDRWVLTTAHCINRSQHKNLAVMLGPERSSFSLSANNTFDQVICAQGLIIPPWFDGGFKHDLGLIYLSRKAVMNSRVRPICMPQSLDIFFRDMSKLDCVVAGYRASTPHPTTWKREFKYSEYHHPLGFDGCNRRAVWDLFWWYYVCADSKSYLGGCPGDPGSPLMCLTKTQGGKRRYLLWGILTSPAEVCERHRWLPQQFIRITSYLSFINKVVLSWEGALPFWWEVPYAFSDFL